MSEFLGKSAIVTGTSGIGRATALRLAAAGAHVLACGNDPDVNSEMEHLAQERALPIRVRLTDVSNESDVAAAVLEADTTNHGIQIIVNAAAVHPFGTAVDTPLEVWNRCLAVNITSIYLFAHYAIPVMKRGGGGAIVNISSVQGYACQTGVTAYATSKGAIHTLTRALAVDHARDGVRVNSVSPGSIATPLLALAARTFSPDEPVDQVFKRFGEAHPLGRVGTAEEVAELIAFLASDRASFCTGGDYLVDGGLKAGIGVR